MAKKLLILTLLLIISYIGTLCFAAVTQPMPRLITAQPGTESPFKFQIQNINNDDAINCTYRPKVNFSGITIDFDERYIIVDEKEIVDVYGEIIIGENVAPGEYHITLCTTCLPLIPRSGASFMIETCSQNININVTGSETTPTKERTPNGEIIINDNINEKLEVEESKNKEMVVVENETTPDDENNHVNVIIRIIFLIIITLLLSPYLKKR